MSMVVHFFGTQCSCICVKNEMFALPTGAVAKYCDEHVCLSVILFVCVSARITPEQQARSLPISFVHGAYGRGSVLLRDGDEIPRGRGSFGVFLPIDNAL